MPVMTFVAIRFSFLPYWAVKIKLLRKITRRIGIRLARVAFGHELRRAYGLMTYLPSTSLNFFLPMRFSRSPTPSSVVL